MRVAIACDWFLKYATQQAAALARTGTDVMLLCRDHAHEFGSSHAERETALDVARAAGVRVVVLPGRVGSATALRGTARALDALRRFRPDIVHLHDNQDPRLAAVARLSRSVVTVHDPLPHPGALRVGRVREALRSAVRTSADAFVVHGNGLAGQLAPQAAGRRIEVVPYGVAVAAEPAPVPAEPAVLFFGRLQPYKGLAILLDAMQLLWEDRPDVRLIVAGDGPEAALIGVDDRIEAHTYYVPEAAVPTLVARASLVALPYIEASQSGVAAIAVGMGVPCVVSAVGGLPDFALDGRYVVPPSDPVALAAALRDRIDHDAATRRRVLDRARAELSWDRAAALTLPVYEAVA